MTASPPLPTDAEDVLGSQGEIERLRRQAARDRAARLEAEAIAERSLRDLYQEQQQLKLLQECTTAANEAVDVASAIDRTIQLVCEYTGWPVGHALMLADEGSEELRSSRIWTMQWPEKYETFRTLTESVSFRVGVGLPGMALARKSPVFLRNLAEQPNFPRREAARETGLASGFAFPITTGLTVAGVLEFFSERNDELNDHFLWSMADVGMQLGRVIERERAAAELRRSRDETEILFASISAALIGLDAEKRITRWNSAAEHCFGISARKALGTHPAALDIAWDWNAVHDAIAVCTRESVPVELDKLPYRQIDGTPGWLHLIANPGDARRTGNLDCVLVALDISHRRRLETQLAQAQKLEAIGQLAAGVSHEINTPIQFISDNLRFVKDGVRDLQNAVEVLLPLAGPAIDLDREELDFLSKELPDAIQQSIRGTERVATIVRAMKHYSHPGGERQDVDLNALVESAATLTSNEWKYVAEVEMHLATEMPKVRCDPSEISQVVLNLIVNAAHAIADVPAVKAGAKGRILLCTRATADRMILTVGDTGTGIPERIRERVFDPFFTTKEVGRGTGQGLFLVHAAVVERHCGSVHFETQSGVGTTFTIELPLR